jgi:RNA polymerase sigma factor (sigma-70 family)
LVRVVTKLSTFRGESSFRTWVYRVAANALLNYRGEVRRKAYSFEEAGQILDTALAQAGERSSSLDPEREALVNEVKLVCTHGMLLCLDRAHRLAYILGAILELPSDEAAAILEVSPVAFRKRLSRARALMEAFLRAHCGIANPAHACRCIKLVPAALEYGLIHPKHAFLERLPTREVELVARRAERFASLRR